MRSIISLLVTGLVLAVCAQPQQTQPDALSQRAVFRILEQGTWGPTPSGSSTLQTSGFDAWFAEQVAAPVSHFADQPVYNAQGNTNTNLTPVQQAFFLNALQGSDQLRQRVAFALSEIWVISQLEINSAAAFPPLLRIFQNRAFDNYENVMYDVTLNPAMGHYLNMVNNDKGNAAKGTTANENYGRELMQLFTLGLTTLNLNGTPVLDANKNAIPTYTQVDVGDISKAFTGWTYPAMPGFVTKGHNPTYYIGPMVAVEANHDTTQKHILGVTLAANRTAEQDLKDALHIVFMHPNLPPFVSQQLIQHLVTSNPSPDYVGRVAAVFEDNGSGVRGDLKAVVRAILSDPEARAGDVPGAMDQQNFGHMREPVLFATGLLRALGGTLAANTGVTSYVTNLGQQLFYPPSVFSYFSPFYRISGGMLAPEFQIYSSQTASNRVNLVNAAIYGGQFDAGTKFDLSLYVAAAQKSSSTLIQLISSNLFHDAMSSQLQGAIQQALTPLTLATDKAKAALYVALTSGEYQIIH